MTVAKRHNRGVCRPRFLSAATAAATALCAACLSLALPSSGGATTLATETCTPPASTTLAHDTQARVYSLPATSEGQQTSAAEPKSVNVFGCTLAAGKTVLLGSTATDLTGAHLMIDPHTLALSGSRVAYCLTEGGIDSNQVYVALRNLATGKLERRPNASPGPLGPESFSKVSRVVLNRAGAFAWISTGSSITGERAREVAAVDSSRKARTFDTAANIDPRSLALHGHRLSWTDGGVRHSAVLR
jgi:hypothetical protein